ncbi:MAG: diguanylate cyclase, partial [Lachnospiraceae bacterium]|nr:diguanylate cyclase [Lachnospiraceae bacterium]
GDEEFAKNSFVMKKGLSFPGWDKWKEINKEGLEVEVYLEKKGDCVMIRTDNLGIAIENMTTVMDDKHKVYVALSGDQVALTDIRIN